ncbi:endoplasmic reticulum-Golgi intermediate compartment protein 1 isoform X3 [Phocoena sinus]|uniref:endoplasmic reticulum-Golgi intermediate compartment protein 1 isoform X3 n=1 Tax=Phocoena sinus TaxID=42100 RepID=UPI0013C537C8|nr:endoplasmic reticulum-Golgi intermediate compartment protein 1 isoform X3 [Phocoena sinus]
MGLIILSSPQGCSDGAFLWKRHLEECLAHMVGLDIQDEMGRHEVGHVDNSMKIPLNNGVGCRFEGQFSINKVPGNFHVSTHSATAQPQNPDMTHVIHKLSFGDTLQVQNVHGAFNALGGADRLTSNPLASHDYILKIVPTVYEDKSGKQRYSYQYTVANKEYVAYSHTGRIIPAIWFRYDLSPITVKYTERRQPLYRFITTVSGRGACCEHPNRSSKKWDAAHRARGSACPHKAGTSRMFRNVIRSTSISMAFHQETLFQMGMPLNHFVP